MLNILEQMTTPTLQMIRTVAKAGKLNKGTWNGCVFNKVGDEYGIQCKNFSSAGAIDPTAADFIRVWDTHREYTTELLLKDVEWVLSHRDDVQPEFETVNMGRVKKVRRRRIATAQHVLTLEELESNFLEELEALLV